MFDLFGIKAKRQAKKEEEKRKELERVAEKKRIYQERKEKIDSYLSKYDADFDAKARAKYKLELEEAERINSTCPKCGSKNVVHKVVRGKGEIHGSGTSSVSGSFGGGLFGVGGSIYGGGSSHIDGEFDTYPVNRCKDCENEWNVEEVDGPSYYGHAFSTYESFSPTFLFRRVEEYYDMKYDPYDVKNKFNSLEEMRQNFIDNYSTSYHFDEYKECPRYMIDYALYKGISEHYYNLDRIDKELYNYQEDDDKYSYTMSDEMWEVVKKIIGWKGTEE